MSEYITKNTIDEKIINQLRKLRTVQREQLYNQLYPKYIEDRQGILKEVVEQLTQAEILYNNAEYKHNRGSFFKSRRDSNAKQSKEAYKEVKRLKDIMDSLTREYEAVCELNTKIKEFDIATEQMILAHICEVQLICGNKKALPMLEG